MLCFVQYLVSSKPIATAPLSFTQEKREVQRFSYLLI